MAAKLTQGLDLRLAEAEVVRARLATWLFAGWSIMSLGFTASPPPELRAQFIGGEPPALQMAALFSVAAASAWLVGRRVKHLLATGRGLSRGEGLLYTTAELGLVLAMLAVPLGTMISPTLVVFSPLPMLLPVIVVLSAQRMDPLIAWFAGLVAAAGYLGLAFWAIEQPSTLPAALLVRSDHMVRASFILAVGAAAALVTRSFRRSSTAALESIAQRNEIRHVFGQHVSPEVVDKLLNQRAETTSELRYVCLMFLDIRGFTTLAESESPADVVSLLNRFFAITIDAINDHQGIINKFLGDGFMAVFGAPLDDERAAHNAVAAAEAILAGIAEGIASGALPPIRIGIGLHAGSAITGNIGSPVRKEYTVIGDAVNLAAEVEALNKRFNSQLLVTESVWERLGRDEENAQVHSDVEIRGREQAVRLYQLA